METPRRPIENGTTKRINNNRPVSQGNGAAPSRTEQGKRTNAVPNRAAMRRPADVQRNMGQTGKTSGMHPAQRQLIRQMTEEQGNGFVLGNLPATVKADKKRQKNDWIPTKKSRVKEPMPLATIVFSILCTVLVMFMMINFVKINEYTHDIADMQTKLDRLERQEQELTVELEKKNDLSNVDLEALGLVKEEGLPKVEITSEQDETVEHFEVEEEDTGVVATVMNALYRNFKEYRTIFFGKE